LIGVSLHNTPMLCRYWDRVGGTLAEEFTAVPGPQALRPVGLVELSSLVASIALSDPMSSTWLDGTSSWSR
jgi:hypothetical protein